jgi:hypothetical protein
MESLKTWETICAIPDVVLREVMFSWYYALCKKGLFARKKVSPQLFILVEQCLSESSQTEMRLRYLQTWLFFKVQLLRGYVSHCHQVDATIERVLSGKLSYFNVTTLRYVVNLSTYPKLVQDLIALEVSSISARLPMPFSEKCRRILVNQQKLGVTIDRRYYENFLPESEKHLLAGS